MEVGTTLAAAHQLELRPVTTTVYPLPTPLGGTGNHLMAAAEDYTPERLMAFLRDAAMQGRVNPAVAKSRQSAIEQLFVELEPAERADIRRIDVDRLWQRLYKLQDGSIRPEVVMVYNKRVQHNTGEGARPSSALSPESSCQSMPDLVAGVTGRAAPDALQ